MAVSLKDWAHPEAGAAPKARSGAADMRAWASGAKPVTPKSLAGAATKTAKMAQLGADSRGHMTHEGAMLHLRAAEAHEAAAKAQKEVGNDEAHKYHAAKALNARETASSILTSTAQRHAEQTIAEDKARGDSKREWVGKQVHPEKMEFSGQFAGHSKETIQDHFVDGKPLTSRAEMHQRDIIGPAFAGKKTAAELGERKTAILTMGGPASGKGVVLSRLSSNGLDPSHYVHIDPDAVKQKLPEYQAQVPEHGGRTFVGAAAQVHEESSHVAKQIRDQAIAAGHHLIIDGTGGNADSFVKLIDHLKDKGYDVHVHHPDLGVEEGTKRALGRAERSGRHVPEPFIRKTYEAIEKARDKIAAAAPHYTRYDAANGHAPVVEKP